jgi:hypothetical protein
MPLELVVAVALATLLPPVQLVPVQILSPTESPLTGLL